MVGQLHERCYPIASYDSPGIGRAATFIAQGNRYSSKPEIIGAGTSGR